MPNSSPTTSADLPLLSQFWTASRLKVSSNFRRSRTDVCFIGLIVHCSPDSLSVNSRYPHTMSLATQFLYCALTCQKRRICCYLFAICCFTGCSCRAFLCVVRLLEENISSVKQIGGRFGQVSLSPRRTGGPKVLGHRLVLQRKVPSACFRNRPGGSRSNLFE